MINGSDRTLRSFSLQIKEAGKEGGILPDLDLISKYSDVVDKWNWADCALSADGEYVLGACDGSRAGEMCKMFLWDKESGALIRQLEGPKEGFGGLKWHPTTSLLATISQSRQCVYLWRFTPQQKFSAYEPWFTEVREERERVHS